MSAAHISNGRAKSKYDTFLFYFQEVYYFCLPSAGGHHSDSHCRDTPKSPGMIAMPTTL